MPEFQMEWLAESAAGVRVLKLTGPFTMTAVFEFQAAVREPAQSATVIDLTGVPYMDSAALGSLLGMHVSYQAHQRRYALIGVSDRIRSLFKMSGVNGFLFTVDSLEQARALSANAASA